MKMLIAIVQDEDASRMMSGLVNGGYHATKLSSTGGLLRSGNTTLLVGVEASQVEDVLAIIRRLGESRRHFVKSASAGMGVLTGVEMGIPPIEVTVGGAVIFVLDVEQYMRI